MKRVFVGWRRLAVPMGALVGAKLSVSLLAEESKEAKTSWKQTVFGNYENRIREMSSPEKVRRGQRGRSVSSELFFFVCRCFSTLPASRTATSGS